MAMQRPIFVAATKQHVGKTTTSLALTSGLAKRFGKVGFMKPVGQQHVLVQTSLTEQTIRVDKDVRLMREHFKLHHIDYQYMSPVLIPRGYTRDYIDGKIGDAQQERAIRNAYKRISEISDVMLCEGTGHVAVGSIVNMNNAKVAAMIGADIVLIANGGLGSAFDDLELNRMVCQHHGVRIAGVVVNRVIPEKYEQTKEYMTKALQRWGVPLLGCIPDRPFLGCPALADVERVFRTRLLSGGAKHRMRHYSVHGGNLVTTSVSDFQENLHMKPSRTLYFCHVTRNDIIRAFLEEHKRRAELGEDFEAALLVCGRKDKYAMQDETRDLIAAFGDLEAPVLHVEFPTIEAIEKVSNYTPKLTIDDPHRVQEAVNHYEPHIDFDLLLHRTSTSDWH
uniref:DRTGG domain-containing protein n=1 Tax=Eutreptiella gymnastica TaxID=73025 RepID=A0A7S4GIR7_9EUGL